MDLGMGDEVTAVEAINGPHLQSKESEHPLKPSSSEMLELNEMVIPEDHDDHKNSPDFFADVLDASNLDRIGASENACTSPHCIDEAGIMVEELTLRNYNDENLAVVGPSSNRDKMLARQNKWHHSYQIAGGSGNGEDARYAINPEFPDQKPLNNNVAENLPSNLNKPVLSTPLLSHSGIRTKIISKSGFSEYFVKNTLKGKGVVFRGPSCEGLGIELKDQIYPKVAGVTKVDPGPLLSTKREAIVPPCHGTPKPLTGLHRDTFHDGVSLREWLNSRKNKGNKVKSLYIFKQIVDMVNNSHSRGVALLELRPSYFKLLMSNEVMYLGSYVEKETLEKSKDQNVIYPENGRNEKRPLEQASFPVVSQWVKKRKPGENTNLVRWWPLFPNRSGVKSAIEPNVNVYGSHFSGNEFNMEYNPTTEYRTLSDSQGLHVRDSSKSVLTSASDPSEVKWYASPEEFNEEQCTLESNIYCLGVLLFELLCSFDSGRAHGVAMMDLRHRIFPPSFLAESPKEAGFCLSLLHPAPSLRPTTREILQSEVINGIQDLSANDLSASINHEDDESELLLHFLESLKEQKHKSSSKLIEELKFLEADIQEVERRQTNNPLFPSCLPNESNLMRNINQLASAYFSVRSNVQCSDDLAVRDDKKFLESVENWSNTNKDDEISKPTDRLGVFFNGLCKYARYSKFKVCGILRNGDLSNSANVICSLSFDRDEDYFAAAGVSKKIKIYDFHALFNDSVDIHYPVIEMSNRSKLSSTCWNSYIRNYLASTDYDGVVKLWDAGTGQGISKYAEHSRRAWSVDFSQVDPTKVASGGDDCTVKLWNINEKNSLCTIRNIANVCCVQFSTKSSHLITFGSADYKTYCYDLRNISTPWCVLAGHARAVSYVKFLDSETLVSASTDNTLKLWDLNKTSASGLSTNACSLTLRGHTNEKNFVGLSVADDGYIVCGSETNEVYAYYRSLPMPITSHKFGSIDPISGKETDDDGGQFVSSVCWRQKSDMVVVASSSGSMKLLQMT